MTTAELLEKWQHRYLNMPGVAAYAIGMIVAKLSGLLLQPFITRWLTPTQFGDYAVLATLSSLVSLLVLVGMVDTLYRLYHDDHYDRQKLYTGAFTITLIASGVLLLPAIIWPALVLPYLPGDISPFALQCLLLSLFIATLCALELAKLRLEDKPLIFMRVQVTFTVVQAVLILCLTPFWEVEGLVLASLIAQVIQWFSLVVDWPRLHFYYPRALLKYGLGICLSGVIGFVTFGAERWMLASSIGTAELAIYNLAVQWAMAAAFIMEPYGMWWYPKRFGFLGSEEGKTYVAAMSVLGCNLAIGISAITIVFACPFLTFWLPDTYAQTSIILPWIVWMMAIKYFSTQLNVGCYAQSHTHHALAIGIIGAVIALVAMWVLIPTYGLLGAIAVGLIVQAFRFLAFLAVSQYLLKIAYPYTQLLWLLAGLSLLTSLQWANQSDHLSTLVSYTLMLVICIVMGTAIYRYWYASQRLRC